MFQGDDGRWGNGWCRRRGGHPHQVLSRCNYWHHLIMIMNIKQELYHCHTIQSKKFRRQCCLVTTSCIIITPCHDACENDNCLADVLARLSSGNLLASSRSTRARCQGRRRWSPTSRWWRSTGLPCWQPWPRSRGWFCWFLNRSNSGPANRPKNSRLRNHRGQAAELHPQRWPGPPQHFISIPIFFHLSTPTSTTWLSGERGVPHNGCLRVPGYSRTTPAAEVCIKKMQNPRIYSSLDREHKSLSTMTQGDVHLFSESRIFWKTKIGPLTNSLE